MHSCFLCIIVFLFSSKRLKDISLFKRRLLATFLKFLKKFSFHLFIVFARSVALFCICLAPAWKFTKLLCISGFSCLIYIKTPQETWLLGGPYWKEGYVNNGCCLSILSYKWQFWKMVCTTQIDTFFGLCTPTEGRRFASSIRVGLSSEALLLLKEPHKTFP